MIAVTLAVYISMTGATTVAGVGCGLPRYLLDHDGQPLALIKVKRSQPARLDQ